MWEPWTNRIVRFSWFPVGVGDRILVCPHVLTIDSQVRQTNPNVHWEELEQRGEENWPMKETIDIQVWPCCCKIWTNLCICFGTKNLLIKMNRRLLDNILLCTEFSRNDTKKKISLILYYSTYMSVNEKWLEIYWPQIKKYDTFKFK